MPDICGNSNGIVFGTGNAESTMKTLKKKFNCFVGLKLIFHHLTLPLAFAMEIPPIRAGKPLNRGNVASFAFKVLADRSTKLKKEQNNRLNS